MKKSLAGIILLLFFASSVFAQGVKITPRKVVHRRTNTDADYKKRYTIVYPKISGVGRSLKQKIERNLRYEKTFNYYFTNGLDEEYHLLDKATYRLIYNKNAILNLRFSIDVSTAYKSHYEKTVAVNLKTGDLIKPEDVFIQSKVEQLAKRLDKSLQAEIAKTVRAVKKDLGENEGGQILAQFKEKIYTPFYLDEFEMSDKGITFVYKYEFVDIARNYEPPGRFFLSYAQLKPFIRRDGLLGKFVR